jgi:hypothetical protein
LTTEGLGTTAGLVAGCRVVFSGVGVDFEVVDAFSVADGEGLSAKFSTGFVLIPLDFLIGAVGSKEIISGSPTKRQRTMNPGDFRLSFILASIGGLVP